MTEQALDELFSAFEAATYPHSEWRHGAHLAVAGCYLTAHPPDEALNRMRGGVRRYNELVGAGNTEDSGYHETLTRFWMHVAAAFLASRPAAETRAEKVTALVNEYGSKRDVFKQYWSFDVVKSRQARRDWFPPDAKPLE